MDYFKCILVGLIFFNLSAPSTQSLYEVLQDISEDNLQNEETNFYEYDELFNPKPFNCTILPRTDPTSVHELTPGDIDIVAAIGDSITAASGMQASNILFASLQYRDDSWSIGGSRVGLEGGSLTLPNILRKYNPNLKGFSTGIGDWESAFAGLNFAIPGSISSDMPDQADRLIAELNSNTDYNMTHDWKLLTILIGGNDMCAACEDSILYDPIAYRLNLEITLDKLRDQVPRMLVQFVPMFDISPIRNVSKGQSCDFLHKLACPCAVYQEFRNPLKDYQRGYYDVIKNIVDSGRYNKEDFTVVLQPYLMEMTPLKLPESDAVDFGFFAVDCFHPSWRGHRVLAYKLWETMFQKVGDKQRSIEWVDGNFYEQEHEFYCPPANDPYIATADNSLYRPPATSADFPVLSDADKANVKRPTRKVMSMGDAIEVLKKIIREEPKAEEVAPLENHYDDLFHPENFSCPTFGKDRTRNLTVHTLTAADIDIVAAAGDSITAGSGLGADNIAGTALEQRGRVWSMGGDGNGSLDTGYLSIPNLLRQYNPDLKGASVEFGEWNSTNSGLNMAVPGGISWDIPYQTRQLIEKLKNDPQYDYENDWKLYTILIGGNDLCATCVDEVYHSPRSFLSSLRTALDALHDEVPKMLVQIAPVFDISPVRLLATDMSCDFLHVLACPCGLFEDFRQPIRSIQQGYYEEIYALLETGRYDTRDDFTVVLQTMFVDFRPLTLPNSILIDTGFFAVDCFHPSWRGHRVMAFNTWGTMFTPVGEKNMSIPSNFYELTPHNYYCPTNETYIQTNRNHGRNPWLDPLDAKMSGKRKVQKRSTIDGLAPPPEKSKMYIGDAVSAVKKLAQSEPKETETAKSTSFQNYAQDTLFHPTDFSCDRIPKTEGGPASVHQLTPADIGIIAAAGDSITAGQGVDAETIIAVSIEQRGKSWSIGGESTLEEGYITLPNILRKYNPDLRGYATDFGTWDTEQAGLNQALPNSVAVLLPTQIERIINALKENYTDAWENEWKLLTILIGRNDLCNHCEDSYYYTIDQFVSSFQRALDLAHAEIPKMLIQIVPTYDISTTRYIAADMADDFTQKLICPCALFEDFRQPLRTIQVSYHERMEELVNSGRYDTRDDFSVVIQPFMVHNDPLTLPGTDIIDREFFAPDCLHPAWRAHRIMAFNLWESMFRPVSEKRTKIPSNYYEFDHYYFCPDENDPYIKTNKNSEGQPPPQPVTTTTVPPVATTTTLQPGMDGSAHKIGQCSFATLVVFLLVVIPRWFV